jgi:hypothetical protein
MIDKLIEIIKYDSESSSVDFKRHQYPLGKHQKKNEILKDISAMANHPSDKEKFILIGIEEKNGMASSFIDIENPIDQANYQQFIEASIEPSINFHYVTFDYEKHKLAAFIISENHQRPYLFKKDIFDSQGSIEYKIGDGYIRTGSSTRKLDRKDIEEIYNKRNEAKDRKSDLRITPKFKRDLEWSTNHVDYILVDFDIENLSSQSIGFDVEFIVFHSDRVSLIRKFDLETKRNEKGLQSIYPQYFSPKIDTTSIQLNIDKLNDSYKASRNHVMGKKYAVNISQKETINDVFLSSVYIERQIEKSSDKFSVILTLRSDSFTDGPLVETHDFNFI